MLNTIRPCIIFCFLGDTVWLNTVKRGHFYWSVVRIKFKSYCSCARSKPKNGNRTLEQRNLLGFITVALY